MTARESISMNINTYINILPYYRFWIHHKIYDS